VRVWPLAGGPARALQGHQQNVNAVSFTPDGKSLVSAGYDLTLRIWPLASEAAPTIVTLPAPLNAAALAPDGEIVAGSADGKVYFLSPVGELRGEAEAGPTPIIAVAASPDGKFIAAAGIRGSVAIIERRSRSVLRTLVGPGLPVWSVTFFPDSRLLLTGGADRLVRRWDATTGEHLGAVAVANDDPLAAYAGERGAEVFRGCVACHTLKPDEGNRAGPTLAGIFGRKIATLPGYHFSEALKQLNITWTPETVAKLFEIGPAAYTPGTKMPEQRIGSPEDRDALVRFLERATGKQ
jgi:cytochrome c